jgi:hypothetical protein
MVNLNFLLILLGVLGGYAVIRTVKREGVRVLLIAMLAVCLVVLLVDRFMPPAVAPSEAAANREATTGFFARQVEGLRTDACLLHVMHETPLGPLAYMLEMHSFLQNYRQAQAASALGQASLGQTADLFARSFGETGADLSPQEAQAVQGKAGPESLCQAFEKWAVRVSGYDPADQRTLWGRLQTAGEALR